MSMKNFNGLGIKQTSAFHPNPNRWAWSVWLTGKHGELQKIDRVTYGLHPCFPNPTRIIRSSDNRFLLSISEQEDTWGTFTLTLRVVWKNGAHQRGQVNLDFKDSNGQSAPHLLEPSPQATTEELFQLAKRMKAKKAFGYARQMLERARLRTTSSTSPEFLETLIQQQALCTYKDADLPFNGRLDQALNILENCRHGLRQTDNPETLGLAGAIYKRKWEVNPQRGFLERSYYYYDCGYQSMRRMDPAHKEYDGGAYTGINASFILDLLAKEEEQEGGHAPQTPVVPQERRDQANTIRHQLIKTLSAFSPDKKNWWISATLAEAHVGISVSAEKGSETVDHYEQAATVLRTALENHPPPDWEKESTTLQIAALLQLHDRDSPSPETSENPGGVKVLRVLVPEYSGIKRAFRGKLGLALSGGGFRASLFHIGVLARLAELDLLREVEVLSCVSGGSIIGAHYYLELRKLLQEKPDKEITKEDYCTLIRRIQEEFLAGVQQNIRTRVAADWLNNVKMVLWPSRYSRTQRLGELYEHHLFARIQDGEQHQPRWLNECFIQPRMTSKEERPEEEFETGFSPKLHNWRRQAKVPILILNATTLNTGHNWQFTASWMGEPGSHLNGHIDVNDHFVPVYYGQAPERHKDVRLGHAVAASSCVPGLFDPLVLEGLYPERTVRLVDGGVHDNQGVQGLLDQDCTFIIVSDASGQMGSDPNPSPGAFGTFLRTNSILQARVRLAQFQDVEARQRALLLKDLIFFHLKQDLDRKVVSPIGPAPFESSKPITQGEQVATKTSYGIEKNVQMFLSEIRTDLDSFTDLEAYALMTSGYRMAEKTTSHLIDHGQAQNDRVDWSFLTIEKALQGDADATPDSQTLHKHLQVGSKIAFKVWSLSPVLRSVSYASVTSLFVLGLWLVTNTSFADTQFSWTISWTVGSLLLFLAVMVLPKMLGPWVGQFGDLLHYRDTLKRMAIGAGMSIIGFLGAWVHLLIFDRMFLSLGRVKIPTQGQNGHTPHPTESHQSALYKLRTKATLE